MDYESKLSEIQSRLESMNSTELILFLKTLYNSTYQKGLDYLDSEEYEKAKEQFNLLANYYSVTADMIAQGNKFTDLRENLDFFRDSAFYLQSKAKKMELEKEVDNAKTFNTLLLEGNFKEAIEV